MHFQALCGVLYSALKCVHWLPNDDYYVQYYDVGAWLLKKLLTIIISVPQK